VNSTIRTFTRRAACATVAALLGLASFGCDKKEAAATGGAAAADASKPITVGFLYVGTKDDYGYNQAHATGAAAVATMPGVKIIEAEKVAETKDAQQNMSTMIEQ
jgi:basic membrane protein A and related proteins